MSLGLWLAVGLAGGLGAALRFTVDGAVVRLVPRPFPFGTMVVNLSASFVLGVLVGATVGSTAQTVVGTGLLGGYSTFSTWMLETERLAAAGRGRWAVANLVVSVVGGVLGVLLGRAIGRGF